MKWPHEYILLGLTKELVSYDQLSVTQWVAGFGRTMRDESDLEVRQHMLDYMISLMDDASDFSWTQCYCVVWNRERSDHMLILWP